MKLKSIIATAVLMLVSFSASAQETGKFFITPMVGANFSKLTQYSDASRRIGLTAGAEVEYQTKPLYSFVAGLKYSQQGGKNTLYRYDDGDVVETIKLDYINVPLLVKFNCDFPTFPKALRGLSFKIGLEPGILINHSSDISGLDKYSNYIYGQSSYNYSSVDDSYYYTSETSYPTVSVNMPFGIGYEYHNFVIDARYVVGLTNAMKIAITSDGSTTTTNIRNQTWMVTLGYKFRL